MQQGYLVLADISGYTSFLAKTELDHAHEILTELLEVIVKSFNPILTLSKLEGDAVFSYAFSENILRGETLLELVEATYAAFRDRATSMHRNTTCTCAACRGINGLDLKFIVHYGEFILQTVANNSEVVGSDVNLAHRLMKNHVAEETGWHAYALFSAKALECMGMRLADAHAEVETYEHLGDTQTYSLNMHDSYKRIVESRQVIVAPEQADFTFSVDFPYPPAVVWEWLNDATKKNAFQTHNIFSDGLRPGGRTQAGVVNHCAHGKGNVIEIIADWRPFAYYTSEHPIMKSVKMVDTHRLEPTAQGTHLDVTIKLEMPLAPRFMRKAMLKQFVDPWREDYLKMLDYMREHIPSSMPAAAPEVAHDKP